MEIFAVSALINGMCVLIAGFFMVFYNMKSKANRLFFALGLSVALWSFGYWEWQLSIAPVSALFWVRILSIGSTIIPVIYFHWIAVFLEREKQEKNKIIFSYILTFIFLLFSFSPLFVAGVSKKIFFPFWPDPGILYGVYLIYSYFFLVIYSIFLLAKEYSASEGERKAQMIYVLIGSFVGFGGGVFNFFLWYNIPIPPYGNFLVALYPFFLGYAIIKYRLFDIKIATTEILVFIMWLFLIIRTLISETSQELLINIITLTAVTIVSYLLVRASLKQAKQKDEIENMAKEIGHALESEKHSLEAEKHAHEELKVLDEAKSQFLVIANHHLRTPLTTVKWYLEMMMDKKNGKLTKKQSNYLNQIYHGNEKEIELVDNLLDLSQFQLGSDVTDLEPEIDIENIVKQIIAGLEAESKQKNINISLKSENNLPKIYANGPRLKVALANIINNAVKYTERGGVKIEIKTVKDSLNNQKLLIAVKDTGIGLSKEEIKNLFVKVFERGEQAKRLFPTGKGIGLYLSSKIIESHKGKIWAESSGEGKGSIFYVELPVSK
ncbi:MAG: ATP-binding protein [Candidatus Staskawiczbacteria bacterium]|jgi:signal transduction histidine kinase